MSLSRAKIAASESSIAPLQRVTAADMGDVNRLILNRTRSHVPLIATLAQHLIDSGGKRIRPTLTLACARLCGEPGARHIPLAAAVEFIHTATLLHDDVVDESKLRRGHATANDVWGNQASVLVGDYLLSQAFQMMVDTKSLRVLQILSEASAIIAQGEVMQLATVSDLSTTRERYLDIITSKTAALFAAACELGAVASHRPDRQVALREFGRCLGLCFQLVDDVLDYAGDQRVLGKTVGDDFRDGKITLPVILACGRADAKEKAFFERTLVAMEQAPEDLAAVTAILHRHHAVEDTLELAKSYGIRAKEGLASFEDSPAKAALLETVDFCLQRAY